VKESLRFQAKAYPGYKHARTMGVVRSKRGGENGERHGWRGEERAARSFVFVRRGEGQVQGKGVVKRKMGESSDEESDRSEDEGQQEDSNAQEDEDEDEQEGWEGIEDSTDEEEAYGD
jgi:25S rRNA (uracil2634-N3)-methyltransferase